MNTGYQVRHRNSDALFAIRSAELRRRLRYLDQRTSGGIRSRERTDTRPGVDKTETIYILNEPASDGGGESELGNTRRKRLIAVERHDEARLQGHASLMSEPAAMSVPRSAEALIDFAENAKDGGTYDAANAAFALALHRHFPRLECSLSVRETPKTPEGNMTNGYYDLAYIQAGSRETCIPVPKLQGEVAYWFAAHADRREPEEHNRTPSGVGPTVADLEAMLGQEEVQKAIRAVLVNDALEEG